MMSNELYADKENRDARARELAAQGYKVTRRSIRNQEIHPMYLEDRKARVSPEDRSFGNTIYKTFFATIYEVAWKGDAR